MPSTADRLTFFTESVIREMTRVSNQYGAINLSQGFPDADPPPEVLAAGKRAMAEGPHQYAITWGAPRFREALLKKQQYWMGLDLDPEAHVVVTCGSTEAMMCAMMTACNPGDKVIIFSPYYENYGAVTILSGAQPIYVPRCILPISCSMRMNSGQPLLRILKLLYCATPPTLPEKSSHRRNLNSSQIYQRSMTPLSSPMKYMSISSTAHTTIAIWQHCLRCSTGPSHAVPCQKPIT